MIRIRSMFDVKSVVYGGAFFGGGGEGHINEGLEYAELSLKLGGEVAVARNPVEAKYAKIHGAPNAIKHSMKIGRIILDYASKDCMEACYKAFEAARGEVIGECKIVDAKLETRGGFDIGTIKLTCGNDKYEIVFFNEYMTLEKNSQRIATFPDLIVLMGPETGLPILSPEALESKGKNVILGHVNKDYLILGDGVKDPEVYRDLEKL